MFALVYSSAYTEYTVAPCETVEEALKLCKERFGMKTPQFGQDDAGVLYTAMGDGLGGIAVISLREVDS